MSNSKIKNCWVQFFDKDAYDTNHHFGTFLGPNEIENLDGHNWPNTSNNMRNDYSSLKTGPNTYLKVFKEAGAEGGQSYVFGPNTFVPKLKHSSVQYDPFGVEKSGPTEDDNFENCINAYIIQDSPF